jgi:transposase
MHQGRKSKYLKKLQEYDFKNLIKSEKNQKTKLFLLAIEQVQKGKSICEVAKIFNVHFNSIRTWIEKFIKEGPKGLLTRPGRGRNRKLTEDEAFKKSVLEMQKDKAGGTIRGIDVLKMMEEKFGVKVCLSSTYVYLKRAHLVWITGRSKNPNSDLKEQASLKKTSKKS